ncbi:GUN4 domain-containing protein [Mastigocoleus testarum]|uniref:GUN4-like domain-containing protein n=1 Tax=Mastigocoleus testarum BC008 TaxID=371196 RepID=A0A0V7ZLK6_9CYAN|nr:GUN4 domain-containing protein [Mastigocoleus testarum]KST65282.1 hypothetical protein BC008_21015 [Mastigocoleus testarum BC008]KST65664.1 hypothetical protein BC008_22070 [Mastigocoleus testarum BC008]
MAQCPICQTESLSELADYCSICGWYVKKYSSSEKISEESFQRELSRTIWAREWWRRSQDNLSKLESKLERATQEQNNLKIELEQLKQERSQLLNQLSEFHSQYFDVETEGERFRVLPKSQESHSQESTPTIVTFDYGRLQNLLANKMWREADLETANILLTLSNRTAEGWLRTVDAENLFASDLQDIDELWKRYTNGHFGFSTQQQVWNKISGNIDAKYETWCQFGNSVGWYQQGTWKAYEQLDFNLNAPSGHLPAAYCELGLGSERLYYWWWLIPTILFSYFKEIV